MFLVFAYTIIKADKSTNIVGSKFVRCDEIFNPKEVFFKWTTDFFHNY
jgi:hypothetical protein